MSRTIRWAATFSILLTVGVIALAADAVLKGTSPALEETLSSAAQRIVAESLPRKFEGQKDWGHTTAVVDGLRLRDRDDQLKLRKHTSEVNDGFWKQYSADIVDPEHQLKLRIANLRETSPNHAAVQVLCSVRLHTVARVEDWKAGIKLFDATCEADSNVDARIDCEMAWRWTSGKYLGEFFVEPKVTGAHLELTHFELKKVAQFEGWAAREVGEHLTGLISKKLHDEEPKIVDKLNMAIAKKQDRLHFSADGVIDNGWSKLQSLLGVGGGDEKQAKPK